MSGMKLIAAKFLFLLAALLACSVQAVAQGPARGPIETARDPILEMNAKHNLDVARYYLIRRKAYSGARDRLQEIIDTHPSFSRMDEVMYLMGEAHLKLNEPEKATEYYNKVVENYPESEFIKRARAQLEKLKADKEVKH
jgi:outer membrane protein assembly factor BamD (BamD/ComL family)